MNPLQHRHVTQIDHHQPGNPTPGGADVDINLQVTLAPLVGSLSFTQVLSSEPDVIAYDVMRKKAYRQLDLRVQGQRRDF